MKRLKKDFWDWMTEKEYGTYTDVDIKPFRIHSEDHYASVFTPTKKMLIAYILEFLKEKKYNLEGVIIEWLFDDDPNIDKLFDDLMEMVEE